jgi:uncharacterized protein YndB with AHSA1/START domain
MSQVNWGAGHNGDRSAASNGAHGIGQRRPGQLSVSGRGLLVLLAAVLAAGPAMAAGQSVRDTSIVDETGARLLRDEIVIQASPTTIWRALTNESAYRRWVAPASFIDLRVGGTVEVSFDPNGKRGDPANLKQEITAYLPERLLVFRNLHNPGAPGGAAYGRLAIILELTPEAPGQTKVTLSQVGYQKGPEFDAMYAFFAIHNPEFLNDLKAFVEKGG